MFIITNDIGRVITSYSNYDGAHQSVLNLLKQGQHSKPSIRYHEVGYCQIIEEWMYSTNTKSDVFTITHMTGRSTD